MKDTSESNGKRKLSREKRNIYNKDTSSQFLDSLRKINKDAISQLQSSTAVPSHKRVLHLVAAPDNDTAWNNSLVQALQYCRHTFSPRTWATVNKDVMKICFPGQDSVSPIPSRSRDRFLANQYTPETSRHFNSASYPVTPQHRYTDNNNNNNKDRVKSSDNIKNDDKSSKSKRKRKTFDCMKVHE